MPIRVATACLLAALSASVAAEEDKAVFDLGTAEAMSLNDNAIIETGDNTFNVARDQPARKGWPKDLVARHHQGAGR